MEQTGATASTPLTVEQASEYLGISRSYLYKMTSTRSIRHYKSAGGKLLYFKSADLDAWAFSRRVKTLDEIEETAINCVALGR